MNEIGIEITEKIETEKKLSKKISAFPTGTNRTEANEEAANLCYIYAMCLCMSMLSVRAPNL